MRQRLIQWMARPDAVPPQPADEGERCVAALRAALGMDVLPSSIVAGRGACFAMARLGRERRLLLLAEETAPRAPFAGERRVVRLGDGELRCLIAPTTPENAEALRRVLPSMRPRPLGLRKSIGCGDRLGLATPGHVQALRSARGRAGVRVGLIPAQQSVRENARTGRTPRQVLDEAMWGLLQEGWHEGFGADADHLKSEEDIAPWVAAGYSLYTIDPGEHVDDEAEREDVAGLEARVAALPWDVLESDPHDLLQRLGGRPVDLGDRTVTLEPLTLLRAAAKYGRAVAHTVRMYRAIAEAVGAIERFELEVSVDETASVTRVEEHLYIAHELRRLGVRWVSLAPRYVGACEKGIDYIGDLDAFRRHFAAHLAVARTYGPYKLSLHSGSDKFSIYPIAAELAGELLHVKTAGTSYLEALRTVALAEPALFREVLALALARFPVDRASYHVSAAATRIPRPDRLTDDALPRLLDDGDARQVLHVTYGSVLQDKGLRDALYDVLHRAEGCYTELLKKHFERHLSALV